MNECADRVWIRRLIWTYFFLIIFEGALRKWVVPSLAGPLLMIRDPFVIAVYLLAFRAGIFPRGMAMITFCTIALLSLFAGLAVLPQAPAVALFGFQATFLHLPLLFVIPRVFDRNEVHKVGYWTLLLSVPMALLMVAQFKASPTAWINAGAGAGAAQIALAGDHIRAAGTFSFVTGAVGFYALAAAFLLNQSFSTRKYPVWLIVAAGLSSAIAGGVAGSRSLVVSVAIVIACALFIGVFLQPRLLLRSVRILCFLTFLGLVASQMPIFSDGLAVFSVRVDQANKAEGGTDGILHGRVLSAYTGAFATLYEAPPLGVGLGMGTNGAGMLTGGTVSRGLDNWENEWERNVYETGPVLGLAFVAFRVFLVLLLGWAGVQHARRGNTLPLLLLSACASNLLSGNFGQATGVGFAVFISGLCLAATRSASSLGTRAGFVVTGADARHELAA